MSNELTIPGANELSEMKEAGSSAKFVPSIKITYGVSKHIGEDGSVPGDFFLDGKKLGTDITGCSIAYRFQVIAMNSEGEFVESLVLTKAGKEDIRFKDREEYKRFMDNNKGNKIEDGFDQLMFIPEINSFGVLFFKKKLADAAEPTMSGSSNGGLVNLATYKKEWKTFSWYQIKVTQAEGKVELPENTQEVLKTYLSQAVIEEEEKPAGGTTRDR